MRERLFTRNPLRVEYERLGRFTLPTQSDRIMRAAQMIRVPRPDRLVGHM